MNRIVRVLAVLAGVVLVPATVLAQASITGVVRDGSGAVLPGVTVEAASPVLIEKVRSVVSDGTGRYQIVDLRPGAYTVTFTLPGFTTFKRDGIVLTGSITVSVDAELRVGALEETITVTGEAPIVDVRSTGSQRVLDAEVVSAVPTARNYATLGVLIPGVSSNVQDVGGNMGDQMASLSAHGSRANDQRLLQNGSALNDLQTAGGSMSGSIPNMGAAAEVTIDFGTGDAESPTGGVRINFIPKDGGNTFSSSVFATYAHENLASDNFTDRLRQRGLTRVNTIKQNWDINPGFGGPIAQDSLWYYASLRFQGAQNYAAGMFENKNAFNPNVWTYEPDLSKPAYSLYADYQDAQARVTWQATPKHKLTGSYDHNTYCRCPNGIDATLAPEAANDRRFPQQRTLVAEWKAPLTNQLLAEGVAFHKTLRWGTMHLRPPSGGGSLDVTPEQLAIYPTLVGVTEQSNGLRYHGPAGTFQNTTVPNYTFRVALSYVTGSHNLKVGTQDSFGFHQVRTYNHEVPYTYRFNNGVPNQLTIFATPYTARSDMNHDLGIFVQDRWTIDRLTLNGGLRFDYLNTDYPEQTIGPAPLAPNRNGSFAAEQNLLWKDLTYRTGAAYDLFGSGRTALRISFNKYLAGQALGGLGSNTNPVGRLVHSTTRNWNDLDRDFFPDCDLTNPDPNGECAAMANRAFGTLQSGEVADLDLRQGWGKRGYNYMFSTGVQHELTRGIGLDVAYFRRWYGNFAVTDNLNLAPEDFDTFTFSAPSHADLPDGGGYPLTAYTLKPSAFGRPANNKVTLSSNYGDQIERWHGGDFSLQARLANGVFLSGGLSTGKTTMDNCEIVAALPEMLSGNGTTVLNTNPGAGAWMPATACHQESPWLTQFKGMGYYTIPRVDVNVAATYQSSPGPVLFANYNVPSAVAAASLGRPLAGGAANQTVQIVQPGELYGERLNQVDFRFGKIFRFGRTRANVSLDLYNAFNADTVTAENANFAVWRTPTNILQARFAKFTFQVDF